jgi:MOSC domain-containing protein YiiM
MNASTPRLISVNVGQPRDVEWQGKIVSTGIFKAPVDGRVRVTRTNLEGDGQADLTVHGGVDKAVYGYPSEHYDFWRNEYPDLHFDWAFFGENLTTEGLFEDEVRIGDRFRIGTAEITVTHPRMPCFKLGLRAGRNDIVKRFLKAERSGFYFSVSREGELGAGDTIERIEQHPTPLSVKHVVQLYTAKTPDRELMNLAISHPVLPEGWREHFAKRAT